MKNAFTVARLENEQGFSLVELLAVVTILTIMTAVSIFYFAGHNKLYKVEDQALKLVDVLQEAKQRALTQRRMMRVQVNIDPQINAIQLIDEKQPGNEADDVVVRTVPLAALAEAQVDGRPLNVTTDPPESTPVVSAPFAQSDHPLSANDRVAVVRFSSDGKAFNRGSNARGSNAVSTGMTFYVWQPRSDDAKRSQMTRAITILGATGSVRMWDYDHARATNNWTQRR